jgi:hypothetical protein
MAGIKCWLKIKSVKLETEVNKVKQDSNPNYLEILISQQENYINLNVLEYNREKNSRIK